MAATPRGVEDRQAVPQGEGHKEAARPYKVAGKSDTPDGNPGNYSAEGLASWYGDAFQGRLTANGEVFDKGALTAAHPSMPLPSYARVTNVNNGRSIVVRINDRGPFHGDRALDVSERVADVLGFKERGMARVRVDYVGPASLKGSDERKLLATYREEGKPVGVSLASLESPDPAASEPTSSSRVANSFASFANISNPQPLASQGRLVEPVLSGFAFGPPTLGGL